MAASIPWQCWDAPGFKSCHAKQWAEAQRVCELAAPNEGFSYPDVPTCISEQSSMRALMNCGSLCPDPGAPAPVPPGDPLEIMEAGAPRPFLKTTGGRVVAAAAVAFVVVMIATWRK